jgi:hypothetical protein
MRYQVPQFIEVEDKIFGPFTFKQFAYLVGGAGICFVLYRFLPLLLSLFFIAPVAALSLALAFYKVHDRPFIKVLENAFYYFFSNKLYLWKQDFSPKKQASLATKEGGELSIPAVSQNKLKDLAWSLDIHESLQEKERRSGK